MSDSFSGFMFGPKEIEMRCDFFKKNICAKCEHGEECYKLNIQMMACCIQYIIDKGGD